MNKITIITLIIVTLVLSLLYTETAMAKTKRIEFEGTRCRESIVNETEEANGRLKQSISEAVWPITTGNDLVDGVWLNYDTISDREILEYPPPRYVQGNGYIVGRLMIIPEAVNGYWLGNFQIMWFGENSYNSAVLEGRGDLTGMKLVIDMENPSASENGIFCSRDGWTEFYGYILKPHGKRKPRDRNDDDDD